jgi:hypothetical protein
MPHDDDRAAAQDLDGDANLLVGARWQGDRGWSEGGVTSFENRSAATSRLEDARLAGTKRVQRVDESDNEERNQATNDDPCEPRTSHSKDTSVRSGEVLARRRPPASVPPVRALLVSASRKRVDGGVYASLCIDLR